MLLASVVLFVAPLSVCTLRYSPAAKAAIRRSFPSKLALNLEESCSGKRPVVRLFKDLRRLTVVARRRKLGSSSKLYSRVRLANSS